MMFCFFHGKKPPTKMSKIGSGGKIRKNTRILQTASDNFSRFLPVNYAVKRVGDFRKLIFANGVRRHEHQRHRRKPHSIRRLYISKGRISRETVPLVKTDATLGVLTRRSRLHFHYHGNILAFYHLVKQTTSDTKSAGIAVDRKMLHICKRRKMPHRSKPDDAAVLIAQTIKPNFPGKKTRIKVGPWTALLFRE